MRKSCDDWGFGADFPFGLGFKGWGGGPRGRRRTQMFESGEMKFVILRLIREKPRHGYEVMKALEEKFRGHYTPSAGSVYPTLQLLEDEGFCARSIPRARRSITSPRRESSTSTSTAMSWTRSSSGSGKRCATSPAVGWAKCRARSRTWRAPRSAGHGALARTIQHSSGWRRS